MKTTHIMVLTVPITAASMMSIEMAALMATKGTKIGKKQT